MIKIRIKESDSEKTIPVPYFIIKSFLIKANEATSNKEKNNDTVNEINKILKTFAKRSPGFTLVEIQENDGTKLTITL